MKKVALDFSSSVKVSPSLKGQILSAARAALKGLPPKIFLGKTQAGKTLSLSLVVIGPSAMKKLNNSYRKKNKPTDVLSFSRMEGFTFPTIQYEIGEVILCLDVARKQAKENKLSLKEEIQRLTIHGVLHLFGYDHETNERDAKIMFTLQEAILESLR